MNRFSEPILRGLDAIEPAVLTRFIAAYQSWLQEVQHRKASPMAWRFIRRRLVQVAVEMLLIAGLLIFSHQLFVHLENSVVATWLSGTVLRIGYWSALGVVVLVPLFAVWRNLGALATIAAEGWHVPALPPRFVEVSLKTAAAIGLGAFLYALFPVQLSAVGWAVIGVAASAVIAIFSRRLIYWHSTWQNSLNDVLAGHGHAAGPEGSADRDALAHRLETWDLQLHACTVPLGATYAGKTLADLQIPSRFGCYVVEVERNRFSIAQPASDFACFAGDKLLLLGRRTEIEKASAFLEGESDSNGHRPDFDHAVLESFIVPEHGPNGLALGDLHLARRTGVRVVGIARDQAKILVPQAREVLRPGDRVLGLGTLDQLREFRSWLAASPQRA